MNVRETLERKPTIGYGLAALLVIIGCGAMYHQAHNFRILPPEQSTKAYYTTEYQLTGDAAVSSLFVDDVNRVPPFDHDGKPAFLAMVYVCNSGKTKWVNTLKRYTPAMQKKVEAFVADAVAKGATHKVETGDFDASGIEVKIPGPGPWISSKNVVAYYGAFKARIPPGAKSDDLNSCAP